MEAIYYVIAIVGICIIPVVLSKIFESKRVLYESFWWDTWDGIRCSNAILHKLRYFPIYWIEHKNNHRNVKTHPNYKYFLERVRDIKNSSGK